MRSAGRRRSSSIAAGRRRRGARPVSVCTVSFGVALPGVSPLGGAARSLAGGLGLLVRHGITPCAAIPVFHHGCWALLDCGGVIPVDPSREGETLGRADAVVFGDES